MHNLHIIVVRGDDCEDAARSALDRIAYWGNENNWRLVGGVASEDNSEQLEAYESRARWPLSFLNPDDDPECHYFDAALAHISEKYTDPVQLPHMHPDDDVARSVDQLFDVVAEHIAQCSEAQGDTLPLYMMGENLRFLREVVDARAFIPQQADAQPEFFAGDYKRVGLTDFTRNTHGKKRYVALLDMHD